MKNYLLDQVKPWGVAYWSVIIVGSWYKKPAWMTLALAISAYLLVRLVYDFIVDSTRVQEALRNMQESRERRDRKEDHDNEI